MKSYGKKCRSEKIAYILSGVFILSSGIPVAASDDSGDVSVRVKEKVEEIIEEYNREIEGIPVGNKIFDSVNALLLADEGL